MAETGTPSPSQSPDTETVFIPENLPEILKTEHTRLLSMDLPYRNHAERIADLEKRLSQGRFHLAVLGQVKRGKSTLLNALLGEDVLPTAVVPLTAIPTFIQYGTERSLRVRYHDNRPDTVIKGEPLKWLQIQLAGFVTEEANPKNTRGVREVEITHPAAILRDVVLIDTPGIGSTFRHNTEVTMNFLPQCDAALFMVSADPPITEVEVAFLSEIRTRIAQLFFVLNKVDYLTEAEQKTALEFYRTVLVRDAGMDPGSRVFPISARIGLQAKDSGDSRLWEESGLAEVSDHLIAFLAHEKNRVLKEAIGRKTFDVLSDVSLQISLQIRALELPVSELESRLLLLDQKIAETEKQRVHAHDILAGDQKRLSERLEAYIKDQRIPLREQLTKVVDDAIVATPANPEQAAQQAVADAIPVWFERELGRISSMEGEQMATVLKSHEERANELIESIRKGAADLFEIPYHAPKGGEVYHLVRKPFWVDHEWESSFSPVSSAVIERILPGSLRESRAKSRMKRQIEVLVIRNLENLRYETLRSIDEGFRKFGADLDENLRLTTEATHGAAHAVLEKRKQHAGMNAKRLDELKKTADEIRGVMRLFGPGA
ncbi:MAG TPA: dynamin family protein [Methanoregulaceae archaeon]|nr:dynamin family protein [Methanoregulaceae archaeon]